MVLAQAMFATMNVFSRLGGETVPWSEVAGARFLFGAAVAIAIARARGRSLRTSDRRNTWLRSIFGTVASIGFFVSITSDRIPLGDAVTLSATAPIFVALLSLPLLGERVSRHTGLAVLLAFIGVAGVVKPTFAAAAPIAALATAGAFFYALAIIWIRKIGPRESAEAIVVHFSCVAAVTLLLISLPGWVTPGSRALLYMLATGVAGGLGQVFMTQAYAMSFAAPTSGLTYLNVIFSHALAIPVFGERISMLQVGGTALVIASGLILTLHAWRSRTEPVSDAPRAVAPPESRL